MDSLDILYINLFNLKNKTMKIEHRKIFPSNQYVPKIFHDPHKNPPAPPSYILNVRSLNIKLVRLAFRKLAVFKSDTYCNRRAHISFLWYS